ncbi:hypothetical protein VNI00_015545 [Paramarasmius palmivorus]|uniref:Uncharacterized protein n=1 Tax=Paramarasmius palmivorus TaxID=297713 RepID=A0AAW0BJY2_9AGAR
MSTSASYRRAQIIPKVTGHKGMDYLLAVQYKVMCRFDLCRIFIKHRIGQAVLFFSVEEEARIVRLERTKIDEFDFRPLLDPDNQQDGGTADIKGIHTEGAPQGYRLFYFEQTTRNGFPINDVITRELEGYTDGLRRPWLGPVVVIWDDDNVITRENLEEKVEAILLDIYNFYEEFVRDEGVPYDPIEAQSADDV